jgi:hypothetical protein
VDAEREHEKAHTEISESLNDRGIDVPTLQEATEQEPSDEVTHDDRLPQPGGHQTEQDGCGDDDQEDEKNGFAFHAFCLFTLPSRRSNRQRASARVRKTASYYSFASMRYRARVQRHHRGESARRSFSKRGAGMVETGVSTGGSTSCLRLRNW